MLSFESEEAKDIFTEQLNNLQEYVCSSKTMDEQTYRASYENKERAMGFIQHQPLGGDFDIYRSRMADTIQPDEDITNPSTFSYVPKNKCTSTFPGLQRCNFSGQSIFYASLSIRTNFQEIDKDCCGGKSVYLSKWHVSKNANANMFRVIPPEGIDIKDDYKGLLKIDINRPAPPHLLSYLRKIGEIFMNNEEGRTKYLPSALISNYIYKFNYTETPIFQGQSPKYHGILYPSVKDKERCSLNAAFVPDFIDDYTNLNWVIKGTVSEDLVSVRMQEIGFCHGNKIFWYKPTVTRESVKPTDYRYLDKSDRPCDLSKGRLFDKNHREVKSPFAVFFTGIDQWMKQKISEIPDDFGNFNDIVDEASFNIKNDKWCIARDLEGWTFETEKETIDVVMVVYMFEYSTTLEEI